MATVKINGKAFKPPKKRITNPLMLDEKYTGEEPIFTGVNFKDESDRRVKLMQAFFYYNYFNSGKHFKKDLIKYAKDELKFSKDKLELLDNAPDWTAELQSGALLRMRSRGLVLRDSEFEYIKNNLEKMMLTAIRKVKEDAAEEAKDAANGHVKREVISVQERLRMKVDATVLGDLEDMLDQWIMGESPSIDVYEAMKAAILPAMASKHIIDWANKHLVEMEGAINKIDPQLVEGYSHLTAKRKKEFVSWFEGIIADAQRFGTNTKTVRKARTKKPVSLEKQISKLKYLKESPEHKLVSINPSLIIGATELWTYNVKYKALTRYIAESGLGFEIKGTSLLKFNTSESQTRALRKPEQTLSEVLSSSKTKAAKLFASLTTKPKEPNGRINEDTIILKVTK
jgi:hypothetical protein